MLILLLNIKDGTEQKKKLRRKQYHYVWMSEYQALGRGYCGCCTFPTLNASALVGATMSRCRI